MQDTRGEDAAGPDAPPRRPALSPSRADDFRRCPLLYRFRAVDKLPEPAGRAQVRGTLVHAVLERLYDLPAPGRLPGAAKELVEPLWRELCAADPALPAALFAGPDDPELAGWLASAAPLLDAYFALEDPRGRVPAARELLVETELASGLPLRGYVDRLDETPGGGLRIVDYKTGPAPRDLTQVRALFQMKFYALALLQLRGVVASELVLLYLGDGSALTYRPDEDELRRFARTLDAIWAAILRAAHDGDFRPNPGPACAWCSHRPLCPAWDGTPPAYPGWPGDAGAARATSHRGDAAGGG